MKEEIVSGDTVYLKSGGHAMVATHRSSDNEAIWHVIWSQNGSIVRDVVPDAALTRAPAAPAMLAAREIIDYVIKVGGDPEYHSDIDDAAVLAKLRAASEALRMALGQTL